MNRQELTALIKSLIERLRLDGQDILAERIENVSTDYLMWDQMVLRLSNLLTTLTPESFTKETSRLLTTLTGQLNVPHFSHDKVIYGPSNEIAVDLARLGLNDWSVRITDAIDSAATGSESYMALRQAFTPLLLSSIPLPADIRNRIVKLRTRIAQSLSLAETDDSDTAELK